MRARSIGASCALAAGLWLPLAQAAPGPAAAAPAPAPAPAPVPAPAAAPAGVAPAPEAVTPAPAPPAPAPPAPPRVDGSAHGGRRLGLAHCIRLALGKTQELQRADARVDEATAQKRKIRGRFGPVLRVEANVMRWDEPTTFGLALPGNLQALVGELPAWVVQEDTTYGLNVVLAQPITSLWAVYEGYRAFSLGEEAAQAERSGVRGDVADKVAEAYFLALTAEQYASIAETAVSTIGAHVERAQALERAEIINHQPVLEAEVRMAEAESQLIQAREGVDLSHRNLSFVMGLSPDEPVVPMPVRESDLPSTEGDAARAESVALAERPELAAARARSEQAEAGVRAAWAQMLPELNVVAGAAYAKGSQFQREAAYFVGAKASWNVWEWGATYYGIEEAEARARQAASGKEQLQEGVRLQVRKAQSDLRTAKRQLEVSRRAVGQAEENLRLVEKRFDQNASASTDVLDAVTLLQRAKVNETNALHAAFRAAYAVRRALGQAPTEGVERAEREESDP
jgi:outer membrane protein